MNNSTFNFPQDLLWQESMDAIKTSIKFQKFENFHKSLIDILPQNSIETRKRNAGIIIRRYFSDNTDNNFQSLCPLVWKYYQNEKILEDIMKYQFMQKENLVSHFLVDCLLKIPYDRFTIEVTKRFSLDIYNEVKKKLIGRLNTILKDMNYIYFDKKQKTYLILKVNTPKTELLILLHYLFSEKPQTISVNNVLENPFWKYIRIYSQNTVREILKEANAKGILSKYVIADTLEQVTTKYSFLEFIEAKIKL